MHPIPAFLLVLALPVQAKRPAPPPVATVPSIEEVVAAEGFTPTPSQSEIYRPGAAPCAGAVLESSMEPTLSTVTTDPTI